MRLSSAAKGSTLLALAAVFFTAEAQSRQRISVRTYRTNYRIDTWDDNRDELYRVTYWKFGLKSVYTFDAAGHVRTLTARPPSGLETMYTFDLASPSRMLMDSGDDPLDDVETDLTPAIDCTTCFNTWDTLCDAGLTEVCFLDDNNPVDFDQDAEDSVRRFCSAVGAACVRTASDVCGDQCEGPNPTTAAPTTVAPTTVAPITEAPTTVAPATVAPTTVAPITVAPTTVAPITVAPTTVAPTTVAPITVAPTTVAPATVAPTTVAPTTVAPTTVAPTTVAPATVAPTPVTPSPTTGEPTPAPTEDLSACNPNPCENGGSCTVDPAGGHTCSCTNNFGGMSCQIDTSDLDAFFIEIDFIGTWTDARRAVFQSAADRWSEVITHVPCGGTTEFPAGRLLISATLEAIDGPGLILGQASPNSVWRSCNTISAEGEMTFDIADIGSLEADGTFEGVILHEMGHVIGVGTLWGANFGECTTCRQDNDPAWLCPAAVATFADIGGTGDEIVELDGATGTSCAHLDENIFDDELMTGFVNNAPLIMSKMSAAVLEDLNYIVDTSVVDAYTLPSERGASLTAGMLPSLVNDTTIDVIIQILDSDGDVVDEVEGFGMQF